MSFHRCKFRSYRTGVTFRHVRIGARIHRIILLLSFVSQSTSLAGRVSRRKKNKKRKHAFSFILVPFGEGPTQKSETAQQGPSKNRSRVLYVCATRSETPHAVNERLQSMQPIFDASFSRNYKGDFPQDSLTSCQSCVL